MAQILHTACTIQFRTLSLPSCWSLPMDIVFVLAIVGFFGLCVAYTYAFDRI
jgi:hypothetical protein